MASLWSASPEKPPAIRAFSSETTFRNESDASNLEAEVFRIDYDDTMTTITLMDRTPGGRMLEKPRHGQSCNGCGYCCAIDVCGLAREYIVTMDDDHEGPCPALEFEDNRFWCGLTRHASRYLGLPNAWADPVLGSLFAEALGVGQGCDASDP